MSPLPDVANASHVISLAMSHVAYYLRPEYAEPAITTRKHDDSLGLEVFGDTDTPASRSTEERVQSVKPLQHGQFWSGHSFW
jgi:hypothetical protein